MPRRWAGLARVWTDEDEGFTEEYIPLVVTGPLQTAHNRGKLLAVKGAEGANPTFNRWEFLISERQYRKDMRDRERLMTGQRKPGPTEIPLRPGGKPRWKNEAYYQQYGNTMEWLFKEDDKQREERRLARKPYQYESLAEEDEARMDRTTARQEREYDKWLAEQERKKNEELPDVPNHWYWEEQ